ncbi:MAG TPA: DUF418 domain-containing protein [Pirellulaceae bacterium]|nr:DUF418 domain-containing protein [Pirellulaceae bacterium]HMO90720.1 DUF418 domain-containing protein [Pirellulaceae bacterium]HMP67971.1 DUF418 domain-containing protein [Pirellulaceae bacterium]
MFNDSVDQPTAGVSEEHDNTGDLSVVRELQSVPDAARIQAIDVARGIALLGIFFVNAEIFGQPFGSILEPSVPTDEGSLSVTIFWFTNIVCAGKFYPLFSILFGAGLAMMFESARRRGRSFEAMFIRRLGLLAIFGMAHIVLLWPGDILLVYAGVGLWMLWLGRYSARTLIKIAGIVYGVGLCIVSLSILIIVAMAGMSASDQVIKEMPQGDTLLGKYFQVLVDWNETEQFDSRIIELEKKIMTRGPFLSAAVVRVVNYLLAAPFIFLMLFWVILPCFCVGAALQKSGFLQGKLPEWNQRLIKLGFFVGFPLSLSGAIAGLSFNSSMLLALSTLTTMLGGPLMSLMYLSLIMQWCKTRQARWLQDIFAKAGRMALSCYLLESLLMSAVMMHWGLARFGNNTWLERAVWLLGIYGAILLFANLWQRFFRLGPLEWIWRVFTYWRFS